MGYLASTCANEDKRRSSYNEGACTVCANLEGGRKISPRDLLISSSNNQCFGCIIIRDAIVAFEIDLEMPDLSIWMTDNRWMGDGCCRIFVDALPNWSGIELEMFTLEGMLSYLGFVILLFCALA
jgi:hypothetical protein